MAKSKDVWKSLREDIIANLDIRREYENFGIKFTGKMTSKGWAEAHSYGREDSTPSAGVNLETGVYKDFTGSTMNIFDFMVHAGKASDWQDAQQQLAKTAGLGARIPKKARAKRPDELLGFNKTFVVASVMGLCRKYGVKPDVLEKIGVRIARYPAKSAQPQIVLAFPIYSPISLLEQPPESYVVQASGENEMINVYQGPTAPPRPEKRIVLGHTGILNRFALENWQTAERIYKVEGLSDMLTLQNFIPEELRKKHIVITNACGADDGGPAWELAAHCSGKEFIIIHDADVPGQFGTSRDKTGGAQRWVSAMKPVAKLVKNVQLPYEVQLKHGKDLRDWIGEPGRTYADLEELVRLTPPEEVQGAGAPAGPDGTEPVQELTPTQKIVHRLQLMVLGHNPASRTREIVLFSIPRKKKFTIPDINKYSFLNFLTDVGDEIKEHVDASPDPAPFKVTWAEVKEALAIEASRAEIGPGSSIGMGFTEVGGNLIIVGAGVWAKMNGGFTVHTEPSFGEKVFEFGDKTEQWFDLREVMNYLPLATNASWRTQQFGYWHSVLMRWDNWGAGQTEKELYSGLVAALTFASWVQDIWVFRPWVAIIGEPNSGKTSLLKMFKDYYGSLGFAGSGSESGLRQTLGNHSRVIMIDEFESSHERIKILDWLRNAGGGSTVVRGTPGQRATQTRVRIIPWMASIEAEMKREAERSRYITVHMGNRTGMDIFERPSVQELEDFRHKSIAMILRVWARAKELEKYLHHNAVIRSISNRYSETHSVPVAMWSAILGESEAECKARFELVMEFCLKNILFSVEADHVTLCERISGALINVGRGETMTVAKLLTCLSYQVKGSEQTPEEVLEKYGIRKMQADDFRGEQRPPAGSIFVFIHHKDVSLKLLQQTEFKDKGIDQLLVRIPGAFRSQQRIGARRVRGVAVPLGAMVSSDSAATKGSGSGGDDFVPSEHRVKSISEEAGI